jgi:hypothetical protein
MKNLGKKLALVCATTAVGMTLFAGVALAAPTLQPDELTGGPHDSRGNCSSCHSIAAPKPAPAPAPAPDAGPIAPAAPRVTPLPATPGYLIFVPAQGAPYVIALPQGAPPMVQAQPAPTQPDVASRVMDDEDDDD